MTILGKIFAILVFLMSLVWFGLTVNLYATRAEWKKAYTAARSEAEKNAKDTEELKKQLILERQTIDARQQAADQSVRAIADQLAATRKELEEQRAAAGRAANATAQLMPTLTEYNASIKKVQDQVDSLSQENAALSTARDQAKVESEQAKRERQDAQIERASFARALEDALFKVQALQDTRAGDVAGGAGAAQFRGEVLDVKGEIIAFSGGLNAGVTEGKEYQVSRNEEPYFVGKVRVTNVSTQSAAGVFTPATGGKAAGKYVPRKGDTVKSR